MPLVLGSGRTRQEQESSDDTGDETQTPSPGPSAVGKTVEHRSARPSWFVSPAHGHVVVRSRRVSRIRTATTAPEAKVTAATSQIAAETPSTSAVMPASNAPTA